MAKREAFRTSLLCSLVFYFAMAENKSKYVLKGLFGKWKRLTLTIFHLILHSGRRRLGHRYIHQTRHMHAFDWSVLLKTMRTNEIMMTREFHWLSRNSMPSSFNVSHHSNGICDLTPMIDSMCHVLGCTSPISEEMLNGNEWTGKINFNKRNVFAKLWQNCCEILCVHYGKMSQHKLTQSFAVSIYLYIYIPPFEHRAVLLILFVIFTELFSLSFFSSISSSLAIFEDVSGIRYLSRSLFCTVAELCRTIAADNGERLKSYTKRSSKWN